MVNKTKIEQDIITDTIATVAELSAKNGGIVDEVVITQADKIIRAKWWGDRPYIRIKADTNQRNEAIRRDHARGERIAYLERKWGLTRQTIYNILKGEK